MATRQKAISDRLPNELIATIIYAMPTSDLVTLCQTCRLFHGLGVPVLYKVVGIDETCAESFCSSVLSNQSLAGYVRSFTIANKSNSPSRRTQYSGILLESVKTLVKVEHLWVDFDLLDDEHRDAFLHCTFPHLASWSLQMYSHRPEVGHIASFADMFRRPIVETLALPFLSRHSKLISLSFSSLFKIKPSSPIPLSSLREFKGPADLVPWLDSPNLRECRLSWWNSGNTDVEPAVLALKSKIPSDRPFVFSSEFCDGVFREILDSLSRNMPHIKTLKARIIRINAPQHEMFEHIRDCLRRFSGLAFLAFDIMENTFTEGEVRALAETFGDACPTLGGFYLSAFKGPFRVLELRLS
ncbi:hypothetical protein B0H11DRAFT_1973412 [Mycena galericulata]|nr:hypothetical protein B0H11DRAFT_1973412 [Mycena galericulata]